MYHNAAYIDARFTSGLPLFVNSCGHQSDFTRPGESYRPTGRTDYLLLLVTSGIYEAYLKDTKHICPAGTVIFYGPNNLQRYAHLLDTVPASMWIHFSGKETENLLKRLNLSTENIYKISQPDNLSKLITEMITEIQAKNKFYIESASLMLQNILLYVAKNSTPSYSTQATPENINNYDIKVPSDVAKIITYFNEHYNETLEINEIAEQLRISHCRFIQLFKKFDSVTPKQYIINLRIRKAKELLVNSTLSINEIASEVGYPNALYFSRIFKKNTGLSPTDYRIKYY
ncbi:MAG: helix-turn-helix domain-containing protein [Clostridia bacterium]|nr:helix-turn-helix domain-containing protein [Clostridia bacterium]